MANAQLQIQFIPSHRGGRILCMHGYMFRCNKTKGTWQSWQCREKNCRARVSTKDDTLVGRGADHNHMSSTANVKVFKTVMPLINIAQSMPIKSIIYSVIMIIIHPHCIILLNDPE